MGVTNDPIYFKSVEQHFSQATPSSVGSSSLKSLRSSSEYSIQLWKCIAAIGIGTCLLAMIWYYISVSLSDPTDNLIIQTRHGLYNGDQNTTDFFCELCQSDVGNYSKHCRACNRCAQDFDHHCKWVNNCIGGKNYAQFFQLINWTTGYQLLYCILLAKTLNDDPASPMKLIVITSLVLNGIMLSLILYLLMLHIWLKHHNLTTYAWIMNTRVSKPMQLQKITQIAAEDPQHMPEDQRGNAQMEEMVGTTGYDIAIHRHKPANGETGEPKNVYSKPDMSPISQNTHDNPQRQLQHLKTNVLLTPQLSITGHLPPIKRGNDKRPTDHRIQFQSEPPIARNNVSFQPQAMNPDLRSPSQDIKDGPQFFYTSNTPRSQ